MSVRRSISQKLQQYIRERAGFLCEYCHTSEMWQYVRFTVDHIIPLSLDGTDTADNLCLACFHCNRQKSSKIKGLDPLTQKEEFLFHPRMQAWSHHFIWSEDKLYIIGVTSIGRTTVESLVLNRERILRIRSADLEIGRHPPVNDPIIGQILASAKKGRSSQ